MALHHEVVTNLEGWTRYRASIEDLLSTCSSSTPHASTTWLSTWWRSFGAGRELRIGLFWREAELVGYAPLMLSHGRFLGVPFRVLQFIGDGISDYGDLFSRADDPTIKEQMVAAIFQRWEWDELNLSSIREASTTLAAFERLGSSRHFSRVGPMERCPYIDLRSRTFEDYLAGLSRKHRRDLRKDRRRLDALGSWSLDFSPAIPPDVLFDEFRKLHASRSEEMGWASLYELPGFRQQFALLMQEQGGDLEVLCSTLRLGTSLLSYTFGFVRNRIYYQWNVGFDRAYEQVAPNKLHHQFLIEECFRRGYVEFDFMRGAYEYKFSWTDVARDNYGIRVLKKTGWRRPVHRILWLQEREPGSFADRCIRATRAVPSLLRRSRAHTSRSLA